MLKPRKIKIAMVAPPFGVTGGPEVMVQNLTNILLKRGEDVTLFAPADWKTDAKHINTLPKSIWNMKDFSRQSLDIRRNLVVASQVKILKHEDEFDIIHLHSQRYAYVIGANLRKPCVLTLHSPINPGMHRLIKEAKIYTVSLTKAQRGNQKTTAIIWNGTQLKNIKPSFKKGKYLISIGRITPDKGIHKSIRIGRAARKKIIIIGRIGTTKERLKYYERHVEPFIDNVNVIHMNEMPHEKMLTYLRKASALIFTPLWEEPFGLVAIEALACGTPVIGTKTGSLPEILRDEKVAYLSKNIGDLIKAARNTDLFDRKKCREYAEKHFSSDDMAEKYLKLYHEILNRIRK